MKLKIQFVTVVTAILFLASCQDNLQTEELVQKHSSVVTRAVIPAILDWENLDWMPVPPGQSAIPSPWVGQGSIASTYGIDVVNDRRSADGWVLVYNTFSSTASGLLVNPYFVLYNKFTGIMRIFLYTTTEFVRPSTYIQDALFLVSNQKSTILNFTGEEWIDLDKNKEIYAQVQPAPLDGSSPLATNKWYMLQYELAYDSNLSNIPYQNIQLSWSLNFYNISQISLGGEMTGTIKSSVGSSSNIFKNIGSFGETIGTGILAGVGNNVLKGAGGQDGKNSLGLPSGLFKALTNGLEKAFTSSAQSLPGKIVGIFSSIFSGSSSKNNLINLNVDINLNLKGTINEGGSFPSSPTTFWVPGTNIASTATGYLPLYNQPLGVFYFNLNDLKVPLSGVWEPDDGTVYIDLTVPHKDYSKYVVINPAITSEAIVTIKKTDLVIWPFRIDGFDYLYNEWNVTCEKEENIGERIMRFEDKNVPPNKNQILYVNPTRMILKSRGSLLRAKKDFKVGVRVIVEVKPKNGGEIKTIIKTFKLALDFSNVKFGD
nr:hypothetical protein [uncultured Bacteroides sp.]